MQAQKSAEFTVARPAAISAILRPPQDGQKPHRLQEKPINFSCRHVSQRTRRKPWASRRAVAYEVVELTPMSELTIIL